MKFILVPVLLLVLLAQTFSKWVVVVEYRLNKNFIAQNLCINKAKPKLHCNGKCQMMKRLAVEEEQNTSGNNTAKIRIQDFVFTDEMPRPVLPSLVYIQLSYNEELAIVKYSSPVASVFHPPSIA
jgi:hypothetical protein